MSGFEQSSCAFHVRVEDLSVRVLVNVHGSGNVVNLLNTIAGSAQTRHSLKVANGDLHRGAKEDAGPLRITRQHTNCAFSLEQGADNRAPHHPGRAGSGC